MYVHRKVRAVAGDVTGYSSHRRCAERTVLEKWVKLAWKRGVPVHSIVRWVRRKTGGFMTIERPIACESGVGCSVPCLLCRRALEKFDMSIECTAVDQQQYKGRVEEAPASRFTRYQRQYFTKK